MKRVRKYSLFVAILICLIALSACFSKKNEQAVESESSYGSQMGSPEIDNTTSAIVGGVGGAYPDDDSVIK